MTALEVDEEEVKKGKGLLLTPNKRITRLPMLLVQIKPGKNSYKWKNEIRQILHLLHLHNKITKKVYNNLIKSLQIMEENMIVIRAPKKNFFNFEWPKYVSENLKHEIEFILKTNESLAENKIKNEIEQLLLKYKHRNNSHEHGKQQNE